MLSESSDLTPMISARNPCRSRHCRFQLPSNSLSPALPDRESAPPANLIVSVSAIQSNRVIADNSTLATGWVGDPCETGWNRIEWTPTARCPMPKILLKDALRITDILPFDIAPACVLDRIAAATSQRETTAAQPTAMRCGNRSFLVAKGLPNGRQPILRKITMNPTVSRTQTGLSLSVHREYRWCQTRASITEDTYLPAEEPIRHTSVLSPHQPGNERRREIVLARRLRKV